MDLKCIRKRDMLCGEDVFFVMTDGCNATCFASASIRVSSSFKHVCVYKKNWSSEKLRWDKGRRI